MSTRLLYRTWLYDVKPKKKKTKANKNKEKVRKNRLFKKKFKTRMKEYAKKLNDNLPRSEVWFQTLFKECSLFNEYRFEFNKIEGKCIIDAACKTLGVAIEVDGSYHDLPEQKFRDEQKDKYLITRGYNVYRIRAYNLVEYDATIQRIRNDIKKVG